MIRKARSGPHRSNPIKQLNWLDSLYLNKLKLKERMNTKNLAAIFSIISFLLTGCTVSKQTVSEKPNIIFIISDDHAYSDYSFMGHEFIETPNIDKLSQESLTFTRGYVSAPLCSPSLASIITGLYAFQHGITGNDPVVEFEGEKSYGKVAPKGAFPPNSYPVQRNTAYQKLAENFYKSKLLTQTLSEIGYRSFQSGKWWIGSAEDAGFDKGMTHGDYTRGGRHGDEGLKIGRQGLDPIYDFMEETKTLDKPFFIWYAPFLPHTPHNPPNVLKEKYLKVAPSPYVARYWAMVEWLDQTIGELLKHVKEKGWEDNTIIVYTCDNGWIQSVDNGRYAPRSKRAPHEGGIRTPIMIKYPGIVEPGINTKNVVSNVDIVPTIQSLLGLAKRNLPGIDVLDEEQLNHRSAVFAESYDHDIANVDDPTQTLLYQIAVENRWKLLIPNTDMIMNNATTRSEEISGYYSKEIQLFNLTKDPNETINVAAEYPEEVDRLTTIINNWWQPKNN